MSAKLFQTKFAELCENSPVIKGLVAKDAQGYLEIHNNVNAPVGNRFPQINFFFWHNDSESVLPAEHCTLNIRIYCAKIAKEPRKTLARIADEIEKMINRRGEIFDEINTSSNEGLRVVRCVRQSRIDGFDSACELYFEELVYDVIESEGENFQLSYGDPDTEWP